MSLKRRDFLKFTLASGAAVSVGNGGVQLGNVLQATHVDEPIPGGVEKWVTTTCTRCPGGCGLRVRLVGGRAVKLEGNPLHPVTGGGVCPVAQASLQALYSPDRVRGPLARAGARGAGGWRSIGWDGALALVAQRLGALRAAGEPDALVVMVGERDGVVPDLFRRFARAFGTPNVLDRAAPDSSELALWAMQGVRAPAAYDLENARYVLSFGVPLLDGWWSPVRQMRALAHIRQGTPGRRGKLVQLEPRLSPTATKADEWVPIVPGTEGAVALGIANVLVTENRYDRAFVAEHTSGFEDWADEHGPHRGLRTLLLEEYAPAAVARTTGVPDDTIRRLALELASFGPGLAIGPAGPGATLEAAVAVHTLNALVGSVERPGGALLASAAPDPGWPEVVPDAVAVRGLAAPALGGARPLVPGGTFADLAFPASARRPKALLLWGANPAFTGPDPAAMTHALAEVPFVVSFSSVLDESALLADLVLPDHVFLEAWNEVPSSPALPRVVVGMAQPAVKPLHDTRHTADVVLDLAHRLGGTVAAALPWKDHDEVLQSRARALQAASGSVFSEKESDAAAAGGTPAAAATPADAKPQPLDDFRDALAKKGGWLGAPYSFGEWSRVLRTRSGRLEFYSLTLREALSAAPPPPALRQALGLAAGDDRVFLPHFAPRAEIGDPAAFPLRLFTFSTLALGEGASADQPYLQEIVAPHLNVAWDAWVELHPATAARLGIDDGDRVWVESPVGRARVRAKLYQGVGPEVAAVVLGQGHTALGRYARGKGGNAALLLPGTPHPLTGAPLYVTRVKVYAA